MILNKKDKSITIAYHNTYTEYYLMILYCCLSYHKAHPYKIAKKVSQMLNTTQTNNLPIKERLLLIYKPSKEMLFYNIGSK